MRKYSPSARLWVVASVLMALGLTVTAAWDEQATAAHVVALALLVLCASVAHFFPIRSLFRGNSYHLTNVFLVAGIIVLPRTLLTLLPLLALLPYTYHRRRPGVWISGAFNISQAVVGVHVARLWLGYCGATTIASPWDLLTLLTAALVFNIVQATMVGIVIALNSHIPFRNTGTFAPDALQGELLSDFLGLVFAGLWMSNPVLLGVVAPILVIAHRMTRIAHLAQMVETDTKTGLHNSRYLERAVDEELIHSRRMNRPLALIFLDLDHFKRINDTHGHVAGDEVLRQVATILTGVVRKGDTLARFGGEEFVAMLPGADAEEALYIAERMRRAVEATPVVAVPGEEIICTVSAGVAMFPDDGADLTALIRAADLAMYRAKATRNTVARAQTHLPVPRVHKEAPAAASAPDPQPHRYVAAAAVLWATVLAGAAVLAGSVAISVFSEGLLTVLTLALLGVTTEMLEVRVAEARGEKVSFSFTIIAVMAAVVVAPFAAPVVSACAALVHVLSAHQRRADKALYNIANPALASAAAAGTYAAFSIGPAGFSAWRLLAALAAVCIFHAVNAGLVSLITGLYLRQPLGAMVRLPALYAPTKIVLGLIGAFGGTIYAALGVVGVLVFAAPVLILRFTLLYHATRSERIIETLQTAKDEVEHAQREQEETLRGVIQMIASIIDAREPWVLGHSQRVAKYAVAIGDEMGLPNTDLAFLQTGGLLHDLGKVGIPEAILNKPGRLSDEEWPVMRQHAALGERILSDVEQLQAVARIVGEHHEHYDGAGYPNGKAGAAISLGGRIVALADALDAILSTRPYSAGRSLEWAMTEVERCAGGQFDPEAVAALHRAVAKLGRDYFSSPPAAGNPPLCCAPPAISDKPASLAS